MHQTAGYPAHPAQFPYDYRTPPRTPEQSGGYQYWSPRQYSYAATPSPKTHARRATGDNTTYKFSTSTYTTPRKSSDYDAYYSSPGHYGSAQTTPLRKSDYVSGSDYKRDGTRYVRVSVDDGRKQRKYSSSKHYSPQSQYVYNDYSDAESEHLPAYEQYERPPPYQRRQSHHERRADHRYYDQVPVYTPAEPQRSRQRRSSYTSKPTPTQTQQPRPRTSTATKPPPKATEADARRWNIPAGYSFKNWDPTEEPILLLGSVFDANSLGKWIYDWTVYYYGPAMPMSEVAGEMWLLLIQLAGKIKRAEECLPRIRRTSSHDLVIEFLESGDRLWQRFSRLLKLCEKYMWNAAKKESGGSKKVTMGKNSGCEFVDSIFGRERELERTEKLMTGMRLWSMRFDANCEDILRNPVA